MIHAIGVEEAAAGLPAAREVIAMSADQSLYRRGRRYLLRFTAPIQREFELSPREAFQFCEWCGGLEPFDELTREDLVREVFPYHWRTLLAVSAGKEGSR